ncbi:uncharacterized protein si:ch211-191i18.2 [Cheilinus undulatus]|uniref:uncharacterized protein si:ch211-191i18.2 n=1 Tax=Cheilinus undulatus TaxID=241271 RepID=UPI001BD3F1B7|nr:uncharacterized protein si:ch211-191i18.2 [Cheilinus undulatus]
MSCLSSLSVYLSGASLILLLTAACQAQYYDYTPAPDYDLDYNATFEYSLFSNTSSEDLDKLSEMFEGPGDEEEEEDTGGEQQEPEVTVTMPTIRETTEQGEVREQDVTVTVATTRAITERGRFDVRDAASLPVSAEIWTLIWTLMILIALNTQQLQHTL